MFCQGYTKEYSGRIKERTIVGNKFNLYSLYPSRGRKLLIRSTNTCRSNVTLCADTKVQVEVHLKWVLNDSGFWELRSSLWVQWPYLSLSSLYLWNVKTKPENCTKKLSRCRWPADCLHTGLLSLLSELLADLENPPSSSPGEILVISTVIMCSVPHKSSPGDHIRAKTRRL